MRTLEISTAHAWIVIIAIVLVLLGGSYGGYRYYLVNQTLISQNARIAELEVGLATASSTNDSLNQSLMASRAANDAFQTQINKLNGTVGTLHQLAETDPQLLAKYSKTYFLNENYVPASLSNIPNGYVYDDGKTYQFLSPVISHLEDMLHAASQAGLSPEVISAYRSFANQAALKEGYTFTYGTGANAFSADQGYSEHQLGTAMDLTTSKTAPALDGFETTPEYAWMLKNAYRYGFILSYPQGNTYYEYEPWHWRYVGVALATYLHQNSENFYDMDQRDIDSYLATFFN